MAIPRTPGARSDGAGVLYLVATPIGNAGDLTLRAIEVLKGVDLVAAEDTRNALRLLRELSIAKKLVSYFDHNKQERAPELLEALRAGRSVALVSDAGTPLVSDPGFRVVNAAIAAGVDVEVVPGPCAAVAALTASGLPTDRFVFAGFLPRAPGERERAARAVAAESATLVFYEAPHRLAETLETLGRALGAARPVVVCFNLTKDYQWFLRGTLGEAHARRGDGEGARRGDNRRRWRAGIAEETWPRAEAVMRALLGRGVEPRLVRDVVVEAFELPKREVYQRVLALAKRDEGDAENGGEGVVEAREDGEGAGDEGAGGGGAGGDEEP